MAAGKKKTSKKRASTRGRRADVTRETSETSIRVKLNIDGTGKASIDSNWTGNTSIRGLSCATFTFLRGCAIVSWVYPARNRPVRGSNSACRVTRSPPASAVVLNPVALARAELS